MVTRQGNRAAPAPLALLLGVAALLPAASAWSGPEVWTGGGPPGGTVLTMAFAADGTTVFAILDPGWLYRSTDQGRSWKRTAEAVASAAAVVATHPTDPAVAWLADSAGTIWRSGDSGATWVAGGTLPSAPVRIAVDPEAPSVLYASFLDWRTLLFRSDDSGLTWVPLGRAPRGGWAATAPGGRLYAMGTMPDHSGLAVSSDRGASWSPLSVPFANYLYGLVADPQTPTTVYLYGENGVARSDDSGATWTYASAGLPGAVDATSMVYVVAFALDPAAPRRLYAVCGGYPDYDAVFSSSDGGVSWTRYGTGLMPRQSFYQNLAVTGRLVVDPAGGHTVLGGGWASAGVTRWPGGLGPAERANAGLPPTDVIAIAVDPGDPRHLLAGTGPIGAFESPDRGASWSQLPGVASTHVAGLAFAPSDPATAYAGGTSGLWRTDDGARSWTKVADIEVCEVDIDPFDPMTVVVDLCPGWAIDWPVPKPLIRSRDGGATWTVLPLSSAFGEGTLFDPRRRGRVYQSGGCPGSVLGTSGFYASDDGGDTWTDVTTQGETRSVVAQAFDFSAPDRLFGISYFGQLMLSQEGATWWLPLPALPGVATAVATDPGSPTSVYAATDQGVFVSRDGGATWTPLGAASVPLSASRLVIRSGRAPIVYAAAPASGVQVLELSPTVRRHLGRAPAGAAGRMSLVARGPNRGEGVRTRPLTGLP